MTVIRNIEIQQGATYYQVVDLIDCEKEPVDISGYTARMSVRADFNSDAEVLISATTENGKLAIAGNELTIDIPPTDTDQLDIDGPVLQTIYDIELISPTSKVTRIYQGDADITRNATV